MDRVLSVCCDAALLNTREHLLTRFGVTVISALGVSNALRLCEDGDFALLILGHTVPSDRKNEIIQSFRRTCGGSILAVHTPWELPVADADYNFDSSDSPGELLALVTRILSHFHRRKAVGEG